MHPGIPWWAENYMYAAGPGMGAPTKAPPSAGQVADGFQPDAAVSPQIWNHWRWQTAELLMSCASLRLLNWQTVDNAATVAITGIGAGMYEPVAGVHLYDCATVGGGGASRAAWSLDSGLLWWVGVPPALGTYSAGLAAGCRSAHDNASNRAIANGLGGGAGVVYDSLAWAAWGSTWGGAGFPGAWTPSDIDHDHAAGLWVVSDPLVVGAGELWVSVGPGGGNIFVPPAATPGFGGGQGPSVVRHTHHAPGTLYPGDPGNQYWVALSPFEKSNSPDGQTWQAAGAAAWAGAQTPYDLAYSAFGTQWMCVALNFGVSGSLIFSDNNFTTWTQTPNFNAVGCPVNSQIAAPSYAKIATDGFGDWLLGIIDCAGGDFELHASLDNGSTWTQVYMPATPVITANSSMDVWYGGGRFALWVDDPTGPTSQVFISLRSAG